jgi:hypothetical protein
MPRRTVAAMNARRGSLVLPVVALLALSGCAAGDAPQPTVSADPPVSQEPPSSTVPPEAAPTRDPDAPDGQCADDALAVDVVPDEGGGAAGSVGYSVTFTNTGDTECALAGYPGVSVVGGGDGTQFGPAAERAEESAVETVPLAPGATAAATMTAVNLAGDGGALECDVAEGDGWRVYPPHSYAAVFVDDPGVPACIDEAVFLHLQSPVRAG